MPDDEAGRALNTPTPTANRKWMTAAETLSRRELGLVDQTVYYVGGGVYRVGWGARVRGAAAAREFIETANPDFARRVSAWQGRGGDPQTGNT